MSEQIQIQHRHHQRDEVAPIIDAPAGGPDDQTNEVLAGAELVLARISQALGERALQSVA